MIEQDDLQRARDLVAQADAQECELLYQLELYKARDSLLTFTKLMHPDPDKPEDPRRSRYDVRPVHRLLAETLERVERGELKRVIFALPPRTGKTELASHKFPAWYIGRHPERSIILATYNGIFANDFGISILETVKSQRYQDVFPKVQLLGNARAASRMTTNGGGSVFCIGRENSASGRGADLLVIDDPIKDKKEADSPLIRDNVWKWFTGVAMSRLMTSKAGVLFIMTRWHEDDPVGRLTDPNNAFFKEAEAQRWTVINIPALAEEGDLLGRPVGEPIWPERFPLAHLIEHRDRDPQSFSALYQGRPSPEEGDFFKLTDIKTYVQRELPKELRYYITSDHSVTTNSRSNKTVMLVGGVDDDMNLWLVDCFWRRVDTEAAVEAMLILMARYAPLMWTAELGHISKAIGPFLRRRMREENVVCSVNEVHPVRDKQTRCQSIQARMNMGRVYFPSFASWFGDAKRTLLAFPNSDDDDFPDALGLFGMQLDRMTTPGKRRSASYDSRHVPRMGTLEWVKASAEARRRIELQNTGGW